MCPCCCRCCGWNTARTSQLIFSSLVIKNYKVFGPYRSKWWISNHFLGPIGCNTHTYTWSRTTISKWSSRWCDSLCGEMPCNLMVAIVLCAKWWTCGASSILFLPNGCLFAQYRCGQSIFTDIHKRSQRLIISTTLSSLNSLAFQNHRRPSEINQLLSLSLIRLNGSSIANQLARNNL